MKSIAKQRKIVAAPDAALMEEEEEVEGDVRVQENKKCQGAVFSCIQSLWICSHFSDSL